MWFRKEEGNIKKIRQASFTVLLPVQNGELWLEQTLISLLNQSRKDYALILIDDGSEDGTLQIISNYENKFDNIRILQVDKMGLSKFLNAGLAVVSTNIVFRQDADDISLGRRFGKKYELL